VTTEKDAARIGARPIAVLPVSLAFDGPQSIQAALGRLWFS
jgi:hypothetical protein